MLIPHVRYVGSLKISFLFAYVHLEFSIWHNSIVQDFVVILDRNKRNDDSIRSDKNPVPRTMTFGMHYSVIWLCVLVFVYRLFVSRPVS